MWQFVYVSAAVINSSSEIEVDEFEKYLKKGYLERYSDSNLNSTFGPFEALIF